ncbi:cytochrome P450 [Pseudomonas sp. NFACC07-1]|uniref:cytochrome P450 n=1 Tax=Pseudomonas sp. NFACC07-1 TaxID=1566239 RepID=UPI0008D570E1|nr:cytochrome P450 [Pseudomonas sp. NFACC07-1]SEI53754.1 Cytochrome P450 [Pseudomonas sp. NFACC07-1]
MNDAEQRARDAGLSVVDWDLELDERFRRQLPSVSAAQAREYSGDKGLFYSSAARGFFVLTSHAMISEALKDWELFSSLGGTFLYLRESPAHRPLPMQMDPPDHTKVRALLAPFFTPQRVQGRYKEEAVALAREIIERVAKLGACDAMSELAEPIATAITLNNMGVSPSLASELTQAVKARSNPSTVGQDKKTYEQGVFTIRDVFLDILAKRRIERADDIPSALLDARIDGEPLADDTILNLCCTAFSAGVHTTSTQMGFAFYYLASKPELRRQIVEDPSCIPMAIEEFLRYESSAVMGGRTVTRSTMFHGVQLEAGDRVMLLHLAANRDPEVFADPDRIDFNRKPNPHLSLGGGPHRCIGSFQARMIMQTLLEEWHRAIPDYSLGDMSNVTYEMAVTGRMSAVPLQFAPRAIQ